MTGTDLPDFLLARIADDEQVARSVQAAEPKSGSDVFTSLSAPTGTVEVSPRRVLAECEAKRRIVELAADRIEVTTLGDTERQYVPGAPDLAVLRLLALPYADHPDYREEWRP